MKNSTGTLKNSAKPFIWATVIFRLLFRISETALWVAIADRSFVSDP
jgi:hypothetical protein